jgi:protein-disulfide isomerase
MGKKRVAAGPGRRPDVVSKAKANAKRSTGPFYAVLGFIAIAGIGILAYVATRPKDLVSTVDAKLPPAKAEGYLLGNPNAPIQVLEFADFECPACSQFATLSEPDVRKRLIDPGIISYRFFDYPLPMHKNTWHASNAAACAADQGKFWEMHDALFNGQDRWNTAATSRPKSVFLGYVRALGLDTGKWEQCFDGRVHQRRIEANATEAERRHVGLTPTFVIGNKMLPGAISYDKFKAYVDSARTQIAADSAVPATVAAPQGKDAKPK